MRPRTRPTDEELVKGACRGDYPAFEVLIDRYGALVYSFALLTRQDQSQAEELTLLTFVRAVEDLGGFDRSHNFVTWLLTIAVRETRRIGESEGGRIRL